MNDRLRTTGLAVVAVLLLFGGAARAEDVGKGLFTWTDDAGVLHMADSLDKVPKEYRARAERLGGQASQEGNTVQEETPAVSTPQENPGGDDAVLKAQWQSRMLDAKRRLQYSEDKYQQLLNRKSELQSKWGAAGAALPPQDVLDEMNRLDGDISAAREEVDKARDMINNVIPDEARRAGVPPGWLREVE